MSVLLDNMIAAEDARRWEEINQPDGLDELLKAADKAVALMREARDTLYDAVTDEMQPSVYDRVVAYVDDLDRLVDDLNYDRTRRFQA